MSTAPDESFELPFGEWVLEAVSEAYYIETRGWAPERAERVADRLQQDRPAQDRLQVVVFFGSKETAFTVPGPYIFLSRRLLQRCRTDAACAWILAHEIAHHDLDHLARVPDWVMRYVKHRGVRVLAALAQGAASRILGPEREEEADRYAVDLCVRAGYHPLDFLGAFDAIEALIRDIGGEEAIYGPDFALLNDLDGQSSLLHRLRIWAWERAHGYYPFRERRERVERYLSSLPWRELGLEREVPQTQASESELERRRGPWKLSPEERGLFTSPPHIPQSDALRPTLRIGSRFWTANLAPGEHVILFSVDDPADRMLAKLEREFGDDFGESMAAAVPNVYRRWWQGHDGNYYVVQTDGCREGVVARLPHGPWKPDITALTCLRPSARDRPTRLPWWNLGHASTDELEAMRNGEAVVVDQQEVEMVDQSPQASPDT